MDREPNLTDQPSPSGADPVDSPAWLVERLEHSIAQAKAGQTVPLEPVLDRLRASIARMEAKRTIAAER